MMKKFKQGEYVYIPSNVIMFLYDKNHHVTPLEQRSDFKKSVRTKEPQHLMFVEKADNDWYQVFYEGGLWTVHKECVYEIEEAQ